MHTFMFTNLLIANVGKTRNSQLIDTCNLKVSYGIASNGPVAFLRLASHMTVLKLQSDWNVQTPFPGPKTVSIFTRHLFSP